GSEQELIVGVYDPTDRGTQPRGKQVLKPGGIYYTPTTGIWQTVWLEPVSQSYIESLKILPDLDRKEVRITVNVARSRPGLGVTVQAPLGSQGKSQSGKPGEELRLPVENLRPWSPEDPFLYELEVVLTAAERDSAHEDSVRTYYGMRKIAVARDEKGVN